MIQLFRYERSSKGIMGVTYLKIKIRATGLTGGNI